MPAWWGLRNLARHPVRTALAVLGLAVTSAMLLDMVLLSGGLERSFEQLLVQRGFQIRVAPGGTMPFDTEATIRHADSLLAVIRADPGVRRAGPLLGGSAWVTTAGTQQVFTVYGIHPAAQAIYQLETGRDLALRDTAGLLLSLPAAAALGARVGDTLALTGLLDPQAGAARVGRRMVVRGTVRVIFDAAGHRSLVLPLPAAQALTGNRVEDRVAAFVVEAMTDSGAQAVADRLQEALPTLSVRSSGEMVAQFRRRLVYFNQLSYILGTISLVITVLLVATLLTITINERLSEIVTLRAIGIQRRTVAVQTMVEGLAITVAGTVLGTGLGTATARYLDSILRSFPGLPASVSFFVPRPGSLALAASVLLLSGAVAGIYPALLAARAPIATTLRTEAT